MGFSVVGVMVMAGSMNLTTIESVKRLLGETEALDADVQAQLEAKIAEVSARAVSSCNRAFEKVERVSYHNGGGRYLYLSEMPVAGITEVLWAPDWDWDAATVYGASDYALLSGGMVGFRWGSWPASPRSGAPGSSGG